MKYIAFQNELTNFSQYCN